MSKKILGRNNNLECLGQAEVCVCNWNAFHEPLIMNHNAKVIPQETTQSKDCVTSVNSYWIAVFLSGWCQNLAKSWKNSSLLLLETVISVWSGITI